MEMKAWLHIPKISRTRASQMEPCVIPSFAGLLSLWRGQSQSILSPVDKIYKNLESLNINQNHNENIWMS